MTKKVLSKRSEASTPIWARAMNDEQLEAILHVDGPLRLLAAAGSGKTRVVSHRIVHLVLACAIEPSRILAVTFSKKAGDEMSKRTSDLGVHGARVGTWHSWCLGVLREPGSPWRSWTIDGSGDRPPRAKYVLKDVIGYKGMNWVGADLNMVSGFIGRCKANLFAPDSPEARALALKIFGSALSASRACEAFARYNDELAAKELLTFDDFLVFVAEYFKDESVLQSWASRYDHVIQDEAQDENFAQKHIASLLAREHRNYMKVGDVFQCHPAGTLIEVEKGHSVPIESLVDGDCVRGWNRNAQKMIGGRRVQIERRPYAGKMYTMEAAERAVDMTPNHRVLARWTDRGSEDCVTYLMWRSDLGFRVGWCKLFATTGTGGSVRVFHFAHRCRIERAEKAWILGVHTSRTDASVQESIIAAKYGIPTATFEAVHGAQHLTTESIAAIFDGVSDENDSRGMSVLTKYDRHFDFPMYPWPGRTRDTVGNIGRMTYFECYASNLLAGYMSVPLPDATNAWTPIASVFVKPFDGDVYSLEVAEDHSYAANGIVVLNSIYSFRGSSPEYLAKFDEEWSDAKTIWLGKNYRSGRNIITAANGIVRPARVPGYEPKDMIAARDFDGKVTARAGETLDDEGRNFVSWINDLAKNGGASFGDITALFRTNAQSRALEEALLGARIPYVVVGGVSFYERKEVRDLLAYLRVACSCGEIDDVKRCINAPFRFLGARFVERVMEAAQLAGKRSALAWGEVVQNVADGERIQDRQKHSAREWSDMITSIAKRVQVGASDGASPEQKTEARPSAILESIIRATRYIEWITKEEGEDSIELSGAANVREMIRVAERFPTVRELIKYIDETILAARKQRMDKQAGGERVLLMTVHRSKGLEWPHVWLSGFNESILPHMKGDPEEERRLAYVATTRARDSLVLSYVRMLSTRAGVRDAQPSRFLLDSGVKLDVPDMDDELHADLDGLAGVQADELRAEADMREIEGSQV